MGVEFSCYGDVAVAVEALDEFGSLVPQVGLRGEIGGCGTLRGWGRGGRGRGAVELGIGEGGEGG